MNRLLEFLAIRKGEGRMAAFVIAIMLFTALGATLGGTGIEALFFARFGVKYLPYMYLGLGFINMLTSFGIAAILGRMPRVILYVLLPLALAVLLFGARLALLGEFKWLYPILWLGKEVFNSLIGLVVWGVAGFVADARQAKRLFPLFNASRILGQVLGGFLTGVLAAFIGTENLLVVWSISMILAFLSCLMLLRGSQLFNFFTRKSHRKPVSLTKEMRRGFQYVRGSSLLRWISLAAILFSVLYFSIALPFSRAATERYVNEEALASFLGLFNGLSTAAAFVASLFLANRLFARFGIMLCILILPLVYLGGFGALLVYPGFLMIVAFRFIQMFWLSGIADSAYQAMFNVAPAERRDQVRTFMDGVPGQAGVFIAGALLIIGDQTLSPGQLYWIGFAAAALCSVAIWQARRGYSEALLDALRAGRPNIFYGEEQPFGGFQKDAIAVRAVLDGIGDPDPVVRRVSIEILGHLSIPEATKRLVDGLGDSDLLVRAASLRALASARATPALLDIAASLYDPEPEIRLEVVSTISKLAEFTPGFFFLLAPMLEDADSRVSTRAAVAMLQFRVSAGNMLAAAERIDAILERSKAHLRNAATLGDMATQLEALRALGEWRDMEAFDFLANELEDRGESAATHGAILTSLARIDPIRALPYLVRSLGDGIASVRETSAQLIGEIGAPAFERVIPELEKTEQEQGALLALNYLPAIPQDQVVFIEDYARRSASRALEYDELRRRVRSAVISDAGAFLADALQSKAREYGTRTLRAIGLLDDRSGMALAIENLGSHDASQKATVLEALDSMRERWRVLVQPLMPLWEDSAALVELSSDTWQKLLGEPDPWLRACAAYAARRSDDPNLQPVLDELARSDPDSFVREAARPVGGDMSTIATLSLMDRILFLRRVPLFENLAPEDLKQVASITEETIFDDGDILAEGGEAGDVLFIIVSGEVSVTTSDDKGTVVELARRGPGEYVGEMAIITREPRSASLTAVGNVRTMCIDQKSFEGLLRDRPDISLAVIRVLSKRIKQNNDLIEQLARESKKRSQ